MADFRWQSGSGRLLEIEDIEDRHLLNIELFLLGRGELALHEGLSKDEARRQHVYDVIRAEIERRGLTLLEATRGPLRGQTEEQINARALELDKASYG